MRTGKLLSVLVPTYNMEGLLESNLKTLVVSESLLPFLEVLVINDGSTDNSLEVATRFQNDYPDTFRVIDKENGNYGSCINVGLGLSTGAFIKIMDADDSYDTSAFESFLLFLKSIEYPVDLVITPYKTTDGRGTILSETRYDIIENTKFQLDSLKEALLRTNLNMPAITFRTQLLRDINYRQTEGISYTDAEWVFMPILHVQNALYFDKSVYLIYSGRPGQTVSSEFMRKNHKQIVQVMTSMLTYYLSLRPVFKINFDYVSEKLYLLLNTVYGRYLLNKDLPIKDIYVLDDVIINSDPSYLNCVNSFRATHSRIKYVQLWHRMSRIGINRGLWYIERFCRLVHGE